MWIIGASSYRSLDLRKASPMATAAEGATSITVLGRSGGCRSPPLEGVEDLDGHAHPLLDHLEEGGDLGGAAGEIEPRDVRVGGGSGVEVERALDLAGHLVGHAWMTRSHFLRDHRVGVLRGVASHLQLLGFVVADVELLLDLLGELVAAIVTSRVKVVSPFASTLMLQTLAPALTSTMVSFLGTRN